MAEESRSPGVTTIAPEVILNIARLTTLGVDGVAYMSHNAAVNELFQRGHRGEGTHIQVENDMVSLNLHVVLKQDVNIRQVSRTIQKEVARAITDMVGMEVGSINIHIEDIDYLVES